MGAQTKEEPSPSELALTLVGIGLVFKVFCTADEEIPAPPPVSDSSAQYPDCAPLPSSYQFKDDGTLRHTETDRTLYLPPLYFIDSMLLRRTRAWPDDGSCRIQEDTIERRMSDAAGMSGVRGPWVAGHIREFLSYANKDSRRSPPPATLTLGKSFQPVRLVPLMLPEDEPLEDLRFSRAYLHSERAWKSLVQDLDLPAYDIQTLIGAGEFQFAGLVRRWRDDWLHEDVHALHMPTMVGLAILKSVETDPEFYNVPSMSRIDAGDKFHSTCKLIYRRLPELAIGYFVGGWVSGALRAGSTTAIMSVGRSTAIPAAEAMQLTRTAVVAESFGFTAATGAQGLFQGEWPAMKPGEVALAAGLIFTDAFTRGLKLADLHRQSMPIRHEVWLVGGVKDIHDGGRSLLKDSLKGSATSFRDLTKTASRGAGPVPPLQRGTVVSVVGEQAQFPATGPFSIGGLQQTFRENEALGLFFSCRAGALGTMPGPVGRIFLEQHVLRPFLKFSQARWSERAIFKELERQAWQHLQAAGTQLRAWEQQYRVQTAIELIRDPSVGPRLLRFFNTQQSGQPPTDPGEHDHGQ